MCGEAVSVSSAELWVTSRGDWWSGPIIDNRGHQSIVSVALNVVSGALDVASMALSCCIDDNGLWSPGVTHSTTVGSTVVLGLRAGYRLAQGSTQARRLVLAADRAQ